MEVGHWDRVVTEEMVIIIKDKVQKVEVDGALDLRRMMKKH